MSLCTQDSQWDKQPLIERTMLPFEAIDQIKDGKKRMVQPDRETSNALFKVFEDWNSILKAKK